MFRLSRWLLIAGGLAMFLFFASCGKNSGNIPDSQANYSGTPGKGQQLSATSASPPARSSRPSPTVPATSTMGEVIFHIDAVPQRASDTLTVTVENQTNQTILFPDHLTDCSVILLERNVPPPPGDGQWEMIAPCRVTTVTQIHSLNPGQHIKVALVPPDQQWISGLYRAALSYWIAGMQSGLTTIFSARFQMNF